MLSFMDQDAIDFSMGIEQPPAVLAVVVRRMGEPGVDPVLRSLPRAGFVAEAGCDDWFRR